MLRSASTSLIRRQAPIAFRSQQQQLPSRRSLFTAAKPTVGHRFRSFVFRLGLVGGVIYLYNTSSLFADTRVERRPHLSAAPPVQHIEEEKLPTIDEIRARAKQKLHSAAQSITEAGEAAKEKADEIIASADRSGKREKMALSPEEIEEEAEEQGAFNEETGEINWDCPCLGGMAHGPCGPEFREAFSCFVFSKEEPKGMDCIDNFKGMQDCFRKYPEIYGEPESDEDIEAEIDEKLESMDVMHDKNATSPVADKIPEPKSTQTMSSSARPASKPTPVDSMESSPPPSSLGKEAPVDKAGTTDIIRPAPGVSGVSDKGGSPSGAVVPAAEKPSGVSR